MIYQAPAKINLNLIVSPRDSKGYHPLRSVVQTVDWYDRLSVEMADEDSLEIEGAVDLPVGDDNLVFTAIHEMRKMVEVPPLHIGLVKEIPVAAGLGGGSADAAAVLVAACDVVGKSHDLARRVAPSVGADVSFPLWGGTAELSGYGEVINPLPGLEGFAVAVVVPQFYLPTAEVYRRWDDLGGPPGFEVPDRLLPPSLRNSFPIRNDLYRAAVDVEPGLGDFVADVGRLWDGMVTMTGSGSACFGFFPDVEGAEEAARSVPDTRAALGVALRPRGVLTPSP